MFRSINEFLEIAPLSQLVFMILKYVIAAAVLAIFSFSFAATAANTYGNNCELASKAIGCAGRCESHHHHPRCCDCPKKGSVSKVKRLNDIFLNLLLSKNPAALNLVDLSKFIAFIQAASKLSPLFDARASSILYSLSFC